MSSIPVFEAKNRLSELLALVQRGQEIEITKRGVPIARLVAAAERPCKTQAERVDEFMAF